MKSHFRKAAAFLLTAVLLITCCASAYGVNYRTLKQGDQGKDVLAMKQRMYYLGYFSTLNVSDQFTGVVTEKVKLLQKTNGLEETGIATPELQELIFSDNCIWLDPTPVPTAVPTPVPAPVGPKLEIDVDNCDEDGFLLSGEPFIYSDRDDGHWIYVSHDIRVEVKQYDSVAEKLVWLETYIKVRDGVKLESFLSNGKKPGSAEVMPTKIAKDNNAILAFSDDFFGYRIAYNIRPGVVIRDGKILYDKTYKASSTNWPPLDVLALFPDGSMKTFTSDEHTAQEYIDMGVTDTFCFGPILVSNGEVFGDVFNWSQKDKDPRMALGMIAPNEYCVLTVTGRRSDSKGATIQWTAKKIAEMGAVEALNLDGGNTTCLVFMGEIINRSESVKSSSIRRVNGMIGVREAE